MKFTETFSYGEEYLSLICYFVQGGIIITITFPECDNTGAWGINICIILSSQLSKAAHKTLSYNSRDKGQDKTEVKRIIKQFLSHISFAFYDCGN